MTTLREAAQQALEALEEYQIKGAFLFSSDKAIAFEQIKRHIEATEMLLRYYT